MIKIRNYLKGEILPERLRTGYETAPACDPQWIWIAVREAEPVAILVTAPAHCVVMIMRLVSTERAHPTDIRSLLVCFVRKVKERGYPGYMTILNPEHETEEALGRIIEQAGGVRIPEAHYVCVGVA